MEAIVFIILQIFFATREVLKFGEYLTIIHRIGGKYTTTFTDAEVNKITVLAYTAQAE